MRRVSARRRAALGVGIALGLTSCADSPAPPIGLSREAQRPDTPRTSEPPPTFLADDVVEHLDSPGGQFRIHFARSGPSVPPAADADGSGIPDYVEMVARTYDAVAAFYHDELGYRDPPTDELVGDGNGGDGRFDVYLVDFAGRADGAYRLERCDSTRTSVCTGYMVQENDFAGYGYPSLETATRILASHEYFHAIQSGYDSDQGTVLGEGTAVWATETFDPRLRDFEAFIQGYFERPDLSLDRVATGPVDAFSYGAALFFQHLSERFGRDIVRELYEDCEDGARGVANPAWLPALDVLLARDYADSFASTFAELARWNLYTGDYADPALAWERGAAYPALAMRETAVPFEDAMVRIAHASARYYVALPAGRDAMTAALIAPEADLAGLRLLIAKRGFEDVHEAWVGPPAEAPTLEMAGSVDLVVAIVDVRIAGESLRPGLCIGSPDEVADCRDSLGATLPDAGPAEEDAAVPPDSGLPVVPPPPVADAGAPDAMAPASPTDDGGCSVGLSGDDDGHGRIVVVWLVGLLACARRRKHHRRA